MLTRLTGFAVFSLFVLMMVPAYGSVTSMSLEKIFYTTDEKFGFIGTMEGADTIFVIIRDAGGNFKGMLSDPSGIDDFDIIPRQVEDYFTSNGIYNATAFTGDEKEEEGFTIQLEFDGNKVFQVVEALLQLNVIPNKTVEVEKIIVKALIEQLLFP